MASPPAARNNISGIAALVPSPEAHIKRQKLIFHCKFGEFDILGGQFTEPTGVAVTPDNEIVVADTNNHRIQVFDKEGNFKFQFGEVTFVPTNWFKKYISRWEREMDSCCIPTGWLSLPPMEILSSQSVLPRTRLIHKFSQ